MTAVQTRPARPAAPAGGTRTSAGVLAATVAIAPPAAPAATHDCHFCDAVLPRGRALTFCPHCGQNLTVRQCPACSAEMDMGWKFCVCCGRGAGS